MSTSTKKPSSKLSSTTVLLLALPFLFFSFTSLGVWTRLLSHHDHYHHHHNNDDDHPSASTAAAERLHD